MGREFGVGNAAAFPPVVAASALSEGLAPRAAAKLWLIQRLEGLPSTSAADYRNWVLSRMTGLFTLALS